MRQPKTIRVALVLHHASGYGRRAGVGVRRFAHARPSWELRVWEPALENLKSLARWRPHGLVGYLKDPALSQRLSRWKIPVVNISQARDRSRFPLVSVDNRGIGRVAAQYLMGLGGRRFAVVGGRTAAYARLREQGFLEALRAERKKGIVIRSTGRSELESLPKPVAIFACHDFLAYHLSRRCAEAPYLIPDEVAILAADNEEESSTLTRPPLSSIPIPSERVGFEAAALLERLLLGERSPEAPVLIPPPLVVERESTRESGGGDPVVAAALAYVSRHAHEGIDVDHVVQNVPASRRTLERRFLERTGRTLGQHLRRTRALPIKRLLSETGLTLEEIARREGFHSAQHLYEFFRGLEGCSPGAYRKRFKAHPER